MTIVVTMVSGSGNASGRDSVDQRFAFGKLFVHPTASVVIWRSVAVIVVRLLPENISTLIKQH